MLFFWHLGQLKEKKCKSISIQISPGQEDKGSVFTRTMYRVEDVKNGFDEDKIFDSFEAAAIWYAKRSRKSNGQLTKKQSKKQAVKPIK